MLWTASQRRKDCNEQNHDAHHLKRVRDNRCDLQTQERGDDSRETAEDPILAITIRQQTETTHDARGKTRHCILFCIQKVLGGTRFW